MALLTWSVVNRGLAIEPSVCYLKQSSMEWLRIQQKAPASLPGTGQKSRAGALRPRFEQVEDVLDIKWRRLSDAGEI
jgi:hypothetical protein